MKSREVRRTILSEAELAGAQAAFDQQGKHPFVKLTIGDKSRRVTFSGTPSDRNAIHQIRRDVRRTLGEMVPASTPVAPTQAIIAPAIVPLVPEPELPAKSEPVPMLWHFTTSMHLPRIITSGGLEPGRDGMIWATTDPNGDRTSTADYHMEGYRAGKIWRTRIGLHPEDFKPWRQVAAEVGYTPTMMDALAKIGRERGADERNWFARTVQLNVERLIGVDVRSYRSHRWQPFDDPQVYIGEGSDGGYEHLKVQREFDDVMGVEIDGVIYMSLRYLGKAGTEDAYNLCLPIPIETLIEDNVAA